MAATIKILLKSSAGPDALQEAIDAATAAMPAGVNPPRAIHERDPITGKQTGVIVNLPTGISGNEQAAAQAAIDENPSYARSGLTENPLVGIEDFETLYSADADGVVKTAPVGNAVIALTNSGNSGGKKASQYVVEASNPLAGTKSIRLEQVAAANGEFTSIYSWVYEGSLTMPVSAQGFSSASATVWSFKAKCAAAPSGATDWARRFICGPSYSSEYMAYDGIKILTWQNVIGAEWFIEWGSGQRTFTGVTDPAVLLDVSVTTNQFEDSVTLNGTKYHNPQSPSGAAPAINNLGPGCQAFMSYAADASRTVGPISLDDLNFDVIDGTV